MPKQKYQVDLSGVKHDLLIEWGFAWRNLVVFINGEKLELQSGEKIRNGFHYKLPNGQGLEVKLEQQFFGNGLDIKIDGVSLKGSHGDPATQVKIALGLSWFLTIVNLLLGCYVYLSQNNQLMSLGFGIYNIFIGAIYGIILISGRFFKFPYLFLVLAAFGFDTFMAIRTVIALNMGPAISGGAIMRYFFILILFKGCKAQWRLYKVDVGR